MRLSSRLLSVSVPLLLILSGAALANTCNDFSTYTCSKSTPDIVHVGGGVASGQSVGILLNSNNFTVNTTNGNGVGDTVIILGAFLNGSPTGSVNGVNFTADANAFEGAANGAILSTWAGLNFCTTNCTVSWGYAVLGTMGSNGLNITASGVPQGTVFYAELVNSDGQIEYITPNSEAGILGSPVPEPTSLTLMGTGLLGIASQIRRKLRRS